MADPLQTAYRAPEIPERILNSVGEIGLSKAEMAEVAKTDPWFIKLQEKREKLQATPVASAEEIKALWSQVVKAYWAWINARLDKEERTELLKLTEGQMRRRLIEVRKRETLKAVGKIQRRLGYRFSPRMTSAGSPGGSPSAMKT
jgi:hypothetical protein